MKDKKSKSIYLLTSAILGVIVLIAVYFLLIATGVIKTRQTKLIISAVNCEKEYDGTELKCTEYEMTYGSLMSGHKIEVYFSGSQTKVGSGVSNLSAKITDSQGADVTGEYQIEYVPGELKVNKRSISISSGSREKYYDNTPLFADPNEYDIVKGSLLRGHEIKIEAVSEITKVGEIENVITATISDNDGVDVTDNYDISYNYGKLSVLANELSIKALSSSFTFDGEAHTEDEYVVENGKERLTQLGHEIEVTVKGEITFVGEEKNIPEVKVFDADGVDVTHLWAITTHEGTLTVNPKPITIYTDSLNKEYDGTPLTAPLDSFSQPNGLVLDHKLTATCVGTQTSVGESANSTMEAVIVNGEGEDVTKNYKLSFVYGIVKVNPRTITIYTASGNWAHDGLEHTKNTDEDWDYSGSLLDGDSIEIEITGAITEVGTARNDCFAKVFNGETDVSANYNIKYQYGELKVFENRWTIYVSTPSQEFDYDGNLHYTESNQVVVTDQTQLQDGHRIVGFNTVRVLDAGTYQNRVLPASEGGYLIEDASGTDVSSSYDIGYKDQSTDLGRITVNYRVLKIETLGAQKEYDGTPLTNSDYYQVIDDTQLLPGHTLTVNSVNGSRVKAGVSDNTVVYTVLDENNNIVTQNYKCDSSYLGKLVVTPKDLHVSITQKTCGYDIDDTTAQLESVAQGLISGDSLISTIYEMGQLSGYPTTVEVSEIYSALIFNSSGENVTGSYRIIVIPSFVTFIPN